MHTGISIGIGPVFPSKTQSARDSLDGECRTEHSTEPHHTLLQHLSIEQFSSSHDPSLSAGLTTQTQTHTHSLLSTLYSLLSPLSSLLYS
ncbi:hypothetical protein BcDW1_10987 [Botrytis cinerea BcDW1]|uniref:Uncharacterized protein n=1 Tax=Botryotinia fuckeliana (strain BcDW1) TaxID=1290391 RepID=M7TGB0_BOTF1|nr:hypothetical protein BcDW1_10987 [Botrytis cinerea BcDW1]